MATSGARSGKSKSSAVDALALLKQDHRDVEEMFDAFEEAKNAQKKADLAQKICQALTVHAQLEEELFYPALREGAADADDALDEAEVEHTSCKQLIADIESMSPEDELYEAKVTVLGEYVRHHVKEEEGEIFKKAKASDLDLKELGAQLAARKVELMEGAAENDAMADQDED
jgi:hemerythrin superfamily protein